jgi:hypothetical protein
MHNDLPPIVTAYFVAEHKKDAKALSLCFSSDGLVQDEGRRHRGQHAIRRWKEDADTKYRYESEALGASVDGDVVTVRVRLTGAFPGSPIEVDNIFTLTDGLIRSLEIHA